MTAPAIRRKTSHSVFERHPRNERRAIADLLTGVSYGVIGVALANSHDLSPDDLPYSDDLIGAQLARAIQCTSELARAATMPPGSMWSTLVGAIRCRDLLAKLTSQHAVELQHASAVNQLRAITAKALYAPVNGDDLSNTGRRCALIDRAVQTAPTVPDREMPELRDFFHDTLISTALDGLNLAASYECGQTHPRLRELHDRLTQNDAQRRRHYGASAD